MGNYSGSVRGKELELELIDDLEGSAILKKIEAVAFLRDSVRFRGHVCWKRS